MLGLKFIHVSKSGHWCPVVIPSSPANKDYPWLIIWPPSIGATQHTSTPPPPPLDKMADDILRCISVNEKFCSLIEISLKFPKSPIDYNPALV